MCWLTKCVLVADKLGILSSAGSIEVRAIKSRLKEPGEKKSH